MLMLHSCATVLKRLAVCVAMLLAAGTSAQPTEMRYLDEIEDVSRWRALASDAVLASVHDALGVDGAGRALVLEFDLANTAGYAAATRELPTELPDDYEISFWLRAEAGRNHFEVKFVDASGDNVWWWRRANYAFSGDWQEVRIKRRQIEFAWGPTQERTLRQFHSIEFVISAGEAGGRGSLWFDRLALKPVDPSNPSLRPTVIASSTLPAHDAAHTLDGRDDTAWRSAGGGAQTLTIDFQQQREFGGLEIDWLPGQHAVRYQIESSTDGRQWRLLRDVQDGNGGRDSHLLPESEARYVRLSMSGAERSYGLVNVHVRDLQFGASPSAFIESLAQRSRRGCYPRAYYNEQTYWTIVGANGGVEESMLSEDGALEVRKSSFSIEPFINVKGRWLTWADVQIEHALADGYLPIPSVYWKHADVQLETRAYTSGRGENETTHAVYRVTNPTKAAQRVTLALVVRPFQVNPPAQFLNTVSGVSPIQDIEFVAPAVHVDRKPRVWARSAPSAFRAATLEAGTPCEWLQGKADRAINAHDEGGFASGALLYELQIPAKRTREIALDLPLGDEPAARGAEQQVAESWREELNRVDVWAPRHAGPLAATMRSALAHVLINRDGAALQPGSRAYERSWIRDGALTSEMLLRLGHEEVVKEFLTWYAPYQFDSGKVPCCVDRRGADPIPENDSQGEFLFLIDALYRYTKDEALLQSLWPAVRKTVAYMDKLRLSERTSENETAERRALFGLMPASISHEGYSAKPMHSYWDNFWSIAGYEAAIHIARTLGHKEDMHRFIESRDQFRSDLYRSLHHAMEQHGIDYLPGAAELGDFDATSTTIALSPVGEQQMLPPKAVEATFERYWREFVKRRASAEWDVYTPYEWRNLGAFIRLRWRDRGVDLIEFFMNDRRPAEWNQWAEVVGREARRSRFVGDMPHGWVASDYVRSLLDMYAFERPADEALVLMAGVPLSWTREEGFGVRNLRTPYGKLTYSLEVQRDRRLLNVEAVEMPRGGVVIAWPEGDHPSGQNIERGSARWVGTEMRITELPFTVTFDR